MKKTKMSKRTTWSIIFLIIIIFSFLCIKSIDEDAWICTKNGWIEHGKLNISKPTVPCGISEEHFLVEKYINDNISFLSSEKEVLGGNFYVTNITWIEDRFGRVEYEDGHIALKALFDYEIQNDDHNAKGEVKITNFKSFNN